MIKLIITESQFNIIKKRISEEIDPSEAYNYNDSLKTVIDGKRNVGFVVATTKKELNDLKNSGLKYIYIENTENYKKFIIYREGGEEDAMKLLKIAKRNDGYLPNKTPEETYEIGILLGYSKDKVIEFIKKRFPDYKFY